MDEPIVLRPKGNQRAQAAGWAVAGLVSFAIFLALGPSSRLVGFAQGWTVFCFVVAFAAYRRSGLEIRFEPDRLVIGRTAIPWRAIREARPGAALLGRVEVRVGVAPGYWDPPRSGRVVIEARPYGKEPDELARMILAHRDRAVGAGPHAGSGPDTGGS